MKINEEIIFCNLGLKVKNGFFPTANLIANLTNLKISLNQATIDG